MSTEEIPNNTDIVKELVRKVKPRMSTGDALKTAFRVVEIIASQKMEPTKEDEALFNAFINGEDWAWDKLENLLYSSNKLITDAEWWRLFADYLALAIAGYVSPAYDVPEDAPVFELPDLLYHAYDYIGCVITTLSRKCFDLYP